MYQIYEILHKEYPQMTYLSKYKKPEEKISKEVIEINRQFIQILKASNVQLSNKKLYNEFLKELTILLIDFNNSGKSLRDFLYSNNTFKNFVSQHKQYSYNIKDLNKRIEEYNPYKKNSDYLATIALINTLKNNSKYIEDKNIKMKSFTCSNTFEEYKCSLLTKEDLLNGMPMVLGGITPCCLNIGATGGNFSLYSILDPNANFVVVKQNGKIISHALIWLSEDKKTIVIDSIDPTMQNNFYNNPRNRGEGEEEINRRKNKNIIKIYNKIAYELLRNNPKIKQVNISLGGNTMKAIGVECKNNTPNIFEQNTNISEITKKKKEIEELTGWFHVPSTISVKPINGDKFSMNNSSIHGITFLNQLTMMRQQKEQKNKSCCEIL